MSGGRLRKRTKHKCHMRVKAERFIVSPRACNLSITQSAQTHWFHDSHSRIYVLEKANIAKPKQAADKRNTAIQ